MNLIFSCRVDNDVYGALSRKRWRCGRFDHGDAAITNAPPGTGVLILADSYPNKKTDVGPAMWEVARQKKLRLFIEYPNAMPEGRTDRPKKLHWERAVVTSSFFGKSLPEGSLLTLNEGYVLPITGVSPLLAAARVAGFDKLHFGLPHTVFPLLYKHPWENVLIASSKLSHCITGRYAPQSAWQTVWTAILRWAQNEALPGELDWPWSVRSSYGKDERLPRKAEYQALKRGLQWFEESRLVVDKSWDKQAERRRTDDQDGVGPMPGKHWKTGTGALGILEGFSSRIAMDGTQSVRYHRRSDCIAESAMAFAFQSDVYGSTYSASVADELLDYLFFKSPMSQGPRAKPKHPSYGLLGWSASPASEGIYYGDDNARAMLGTMATAVLLRKGKWNEPLLRCLLANLRTTGSQGFRHHSLKEASLSQKGWEGYEREAFVDLWPHYGAYLWACFLRAYALTGYEPFLQKTRKAITLMMENYPQGWSWTNGFQQERARMLLPLSWLLRLEETPTHRKWLQTLLMDLLKGQADCGAIREELGQEGKGSYGPPNSNETYGESEATLLHENGDPVCDLLYTTNFAFLGLHEAARVLKEPSYQEAEDRLAHFLCRIQIRSLTHQELDSGWFRAFDFERWEHWGSNADVGWGAWCIQTGWSQSWICAVLALRHLNTSLWELTETLALKDPLDSTLAVMTP